MKEKESNSEMLHFRTSKKDVNTATISPFMVGGGLEASCD